MGRPSNTAQRRGEIIAALRATMAQEGYERATIALIAERAGLTAGLVHYHFDSKREILLSLTDDLLLRTSARLATALEGATSPPTARAALLRAVDALVGLGPGADAEAMACWVAIAAESIRDLEVRARYELALRAAVATLAEVATTALPPTRGRRREAEALASGIVAATQGYFTLASAAPGVVPMGSARITLSQMVLAALEGTGVASKQGGSS